MKSMIRKSGVTPAVWASKLARVTPRRSAVGHSSSRQDRKFAAAARMASACMAGCPDEPDSPLHGSTADAGPAGGASAVAGTEPVVGLDEDRERRSKPWGRAGPVAATKPVAATQKAAADNLVERDNFAIV